MTKKKCNTCSEVKDLDDFHREAARPDGHKSICKICIRKTSKAYYEKHADHLREYSKEWGRKNRDKRREYCRANPEKHRGDPVKDNARKVRWDKAHRINRIAYQKVTDALRSGRLTKEPCVVCGDENVQGHHEDYSKPLDLIWLCGIHHKQLHNGVVYF